MSTLAREFANKELTGNIDGKDNVSIRLGGAGVGDTALSKAQGLKMLTSGWQAVLDAPITRQAAACCPAITSHSDSAFPHCLKHPAALAALSF